MPSVQHDPLDVIYDIHKHTILCSKHVTKSKNGSLVDRGANGGVLGNDARVILQHHREVDVRGIDNHELNSLKIVAGRFCSCTNSIWRRHSNHETVRVPFRPPDHPFLWTNRVLQEHGR